MAVWPYVLIVIKKIAKSIFIVVLARPQRRVVDVSVPVSNTPVFGDNYKQESAAVTVVSDVIHQVDRSLGKSCALDSEGICFGIFLNERVLVEPKYLSMLIVSA